MTNINKVSQAVVSQTPDFIEQDYPLFNKFLEYYYLSQEKTGMGQNILNNFLGYLDIDKLDIGILDGATKVVEDITATSDTIIVESVDKFLDTNGTILIGDEVVYYETVTAAPDIALSPGISYDQVKLKWINLASPLLSFDGTTRTFPLTSQDNPIAAPSAQHLIVSNYGKVLIPGTDYAVSGTNIVFTTAPRARVPSDDSSSTYITYLNGFNENTIVALDNLSNGFGEQKRQFTITKSGTRYEPVVDEYVLAVYDNRLLVPKVDFFIDGDQFIFLTAPLNGRYLSLYAIEAPIPSFGSGAVGYARISDTGTLSSISVNTNGTKYRFAYPPKVSINSATGSGASATSLVNGIKSVTLLDGGAGYSATNPPTVQIQTPTATGSTAATLKATVGTDGAVSSLEVTNSGSGYTFTPRITFKQPGGAKLGTPTITSGKITGTVPITDGGQGYTTIPTVYVDEPTGTNPVRAALTATLTNGVVTGITIANAGSGYTETPRIAIIDPVGAQILETKVDSDGRVIDIDLLSGGSGYTDIPSVYIVDNRTDATGAYAGGTGAKATASIFNGKITDINVSTFGTGYSQTSPPDVVIQSPPAAEASATTGLNEITGFTINQAGTGYTKASFNKCARAASGITSYTEDGNAVFTNMTTAAAHVTNDNIKCLDQLFVKRLLDKYTEQYLPDVPTLDYKTIDVRTAIKTIKDFYGSKGTSYSIGYLFKLLYGEQVSISYPKDQIIKPSDATWSIDTILRATLVSGDPENIRDGLLTQDADIADTNVKAASALVENYISIKTSKLEIYELVLSEETIAGTFIVPYKTKLAEPLDKTASIITVDSTIGWPERNGEFLIGSSTDTAELIQYKEKSLNQFIECTRSVNSVVEDWDSATEVKSNFKVYVNKGTAQEVVMNIVGIVDAQQTTLTDTGSYYLPGDKLTVSKLGGTGTSPELTTWLYNVKKLISVSTITYGGVNDQSATVTCANNHGLLVGDQVTIYGANPIIYNGTFLVTSRDSATVFQYNLPQPATVIPQGNILVSIDLNKGKSENAAVLNAIGPYTTNIQNSFFNDTYVYVASTGIPNYNIGPFPGSALLPGNQRKLTRFPISPTTISTKNNIAAGPIGTWVNGVSVWSYKSTLSKTFGAVTSIDITNAGSGYDAAYPPKITISDGGGSGATASVVVNGSVSEITVSTGGSGYTSSPLVSIVGGGGSGAAATAIITKGVVSRVLINSGGSGYTSQPSITIVGGGGTGATATASVRGPIKSIGVDTGGNSYTSNPSVTLSSGSGAVAQPVISNGRIISIAIISAGSGYTTAPEIDIQGAGFGAVARATIDLDGENAGRVTGITIVNRGIGYVQGTTVINLNSIGLGAVFSPNVFKWTYNLQATATLDSAKGGVFEGFNNQYGGEYGHISNPQRLRYILGDSLQEQTAGTITEQESQITHSPIIGWAFDGNPIYGPYGYSDPTDQTSTINRLLTSYRLKEALVYNATTNPLPVREAGPLLTSEAAGNFVEDYEYVFGLGGLDQYNGRFCKTPEYPNGRYCYFVTIDATEAGNPVFPYVIGPSFNSVVDAWNLSTSAIQQNIPTGVVRYRDPYENVDIDVDRAPNVSTNALTTEAGDILLFEIEDEDRSGVIDQAETDDPDQMFEESPLQLFDYFPTVTFDSKVDIEVETITKFEDASVTGFTVENSGKNYQVNDRLIFDNTDTDGTGVSARISRIKGETVASYNFENVGGTNYGVLKTSTPHNLSVGDSVFLTYTPIMNNTNKTFVVRQLKGIEEIVVNTTGSGYSSDIPPVITIDSTSGSAGSLEAVVTTVGSIETVNILNSGSGYTSNPRVILSHPQIFKKADYYVSKIENQDYVKVNDAVVNTKKEVFICGKTLDATGNTVGFVAKLSATGVKEWQKTLESTDGQTYTEFQKLYVEGNDVWAVGNNKPNAALLAAYNPDVILAKYTQATNGLSATLTFQKAYAGISGSTRSDNVTAITKYSDTRFVIGGYTNTNSANPYDAYIALIDTTGNFALKRKVASTSSSEKITGLIVKGSNIYFSLEIAATQAATAVDVGFGKATVGTTAITVDYVKNYSNTLYSFLDSSCAIDEFDEVYLTATLRLKSNNTTKDSFWVGKVDLTGDLIWNYRYLISAGTITAASKSEIDLFGDLNVIVNKSATSNGEKTVETLKIGYNGLLKEHSTNVFNVNNIEGITAYGMAIDESADVHVFGQTSWNRNEFVYDFAGNEQTDVTGHYTLTSTSTTNSITYADNVAKILGYNPAGSNSTWINSHLKVTGTQLKTKLSGDWTLEFQIYKDSTTSQTLSQTGQTLCAIGGAQDATGGLWLGYDISSGKLQFAVTNSSTALNTATPIESTQTTMYYNNSWQFVAITKIGTAFKVYVNGVEVISGTQSSTQLENKDLYFGQQVGWGSGAADFNQNKQGQFYIDNIRLRNKGVTPTVPTDVTGVPPSNNTFGFAFDWVDDAWFTTHLNKYDYIDYVGWGIKIDKNADAVRVGTFTERTNTKLGFIRANVSPVVGSTLTMASTGLGLAEAGFQSLDFDDATTTMSQDTETLTYTQDIWSSRTATVPSPGSQKLSVSAVVKDRYYFKVTNTVKIDNVQKLTLNQSFTFTNNAKLQLYDGSTFINSGYIIKQDADNKQVYLAINNNAWSNDLNTGTLSTVQFSEQSTYGIVGPIPNDINEITSYSFAQINNTTPGTFDIDLNDFNHPEGGSNNMDELSKFKPYADADYSIRIDEVAGGSAYIVGSVITIASGNISFNAAYTTAQITGLTGVLKITLVANLTKVLQVSAVANSDEVYVITGTSHYLKKGEMIFVDGNPSQQVGATTYDEYDGSFPVDTVVSPLEFTYKLNSIAVTDPATTAANVSIFVKSPVLKMYYGHQYLFDLSHSSLVGGNLSFAKDNLYKLEYSFNSIERVGTPGVTGQGITTPTVKLKVDENVVTNISYYFDPSRTTDADSPVISGSYLDVTDSPYKGTFTISSISGATITTGADTFKFVLLNEPEGAADITQTSYSTSSVKAVGAISNIRIVNPGGFYTKLPIVTGITSTRVIERVQIETPGTEYAVGEYTGVPIAGDGEGGLVSITVADGTDDEGTVIPGQINNVVVTSPGKGYTSGTIDIEAISGILGSGLTGSGAVLNVIIPSNGTEASIFTQGTSVGKIKKLKNNNFGYDYPHDYTLRPEITFPINAQLTSTSILDSITITDPGSGYSQAPAVVITGGGGTGAQAEATIRNGRLDQVIVKDPGAGYSSTPLVSLRSSFNYVINIDLGLLQFAFPHGIANGSAITLNVVDTGSGAEFPLAAGATGRLNGTTTYYAITGTANSLENDQLKVAITAANAELGDALTFTNAGTGRQQVLTESFGGGASANVITSTFLEGELVYQGDSLASATATGYVSTNEGWQVGPRVLKIVDYTGTFAETQKLTGVISKSSGTISDLNIAKGVLEIGSITKTTGQFIDDVGKPSEIIQKIQDSYYYQDFSYAVKSAVSISDWKEILIKNVHPASFKVFGELNLSDYGSIPNKETDFQLTKSVELAREAIVPNIQSFALVEPVYSEFNNTEVLFRQKRLTSSENILTSVVQRLDDISSLFDGERISFPLQVNQTNVVANANQLMIVLNGVVQNPGTSFSIQGDSVVFSEPPQPPASVKYVNVTISQQTTKTNTFTNISGIFPSVGNALVGTVSGARLTVTSVVGNVIDGFITEGTFIIGENVTVGATGFNANIATQSDVSNIGLFQYGETITNLTSDTAKVEQINLATGQETPLAQLRYTIGPSTTDFEVVEYKTDNSAADTVVPVGTFTATKKYQFGSEIFLVNSITQGSDSTTLNVTRAQDGTAAVSQQEDLPVYGTDISVTTSLTLSKTAGTYQSTPGLFDIQLNDYIIGAKSGVVAKITATAVYTDPITNEAISQVNISAGSSFFGLLFNRIASQTYPNQVLDDISKSQVSIVKFTDTNITDGLSSTAFNAEFPANERINNYVVPYDNATGAFAENEFIRNYKLEYGNNIGEFTAGESGKVRKLTYTLPQGDGFFSAGQIIRTRDTKAEVIGYNQARQTVYIGKIGRTKATGEDYHAITFTGNAQLDTAQKKFGTASLLCDGTGDYTNIVTSTEFGLATGSFTIEAYVRPANVSGTKVIIDFRTAATEVSPMLQMNNAALEFYVNGSVVASGGTLAANTWHHIAVVKGGTTTKLYVDGTKVGSDYTDNNNYGATKPIRIGADVAGANGFNGHVDEVRVSNTNRYTANFTPLVGIHQGDSNTVLLLHYDGADAQTWVEDWSGGESFTNGEYFNNDAIRATHRSSANAPSGYVNKTNRYYNAADLIELNKEFLAQEVVFILKRRHPHHTIKGSEVDCEDDVRDVLTAIIYDLRNGGNNKIWDASSYYIDRTTTPVTLKFVTNEVDEVVYTYDKLEQIVKYILTNTPWEVQGDHGLKQKFDTSITESDGTSPTALTPTAATYNAVTGDMILTVASHGLNAETQITATNAAYVASTGVLTLTKSGHGLANGTRIKLDHNSIVMSCTSDSNTVNQSYPRPDDPAAQGWLEISNVQTNTFDINVGKSPTVNYTPSAGTYNAETGFLTMNIGKHNLRTGRKYTASNASYDPAGGVMTITIGNNIDVDSAAYDPASGDLVMTIGTHNFDIGDKVKIAKNSLFFTCSMDEHRSVHAYPRDGDPAFNADLEITDTTGTSITVNVGTTPIVSYTATGATYTPATGVMELTIGSHSIAVNDSIRIADNSLTFTCAEDSDQTSHTYPRAITDPLAAPTGATYNPNTGIMQMTINSHGMSGPSTTTPTAATYDADTGIMRLTKSSHGFKVGDMVKLDDGAITFSCTMDSNATNHAYPRATDPISGQWVAIVAAATNTFDIPVGASELGDYTHTFVSAVTNGVKKANDVMKIADNGISFKCAEDGNNSIHSYPRPGDPMSGKWMVIEAAATNTIDVQVLDSVPSTHTSVHTFNNAVTGSFLKKRDPFQGTSIPVTAVTGTTITVNVGISSNTTAHTWTAAGVNGISSGGNYTHKYVDSATGAIIPNHGFYVGDRVMVEKGALVFTCAQDSHGTRHAYPRITDPYFNKWIKIINVTTNTFGINVGVSSNTTAHTFKFCTPNGIVRSGETIRMAKDAISFTCSQDGYATVHSYPRGDDPVASTSIPIYNDGSEHTATTASYNSSTGAMVITVPAHGFAVDDQIRIENNSLTFACKKDSNQTLHSYPRETDPYVRRWLRISAVTTNTFTVNVGAANSTDDRYDHTFVSATPKGIVKRDNTITVNVGPTPNKNFVPTTGAYTPASGALELTIGSHSLPAPTTHTVTGAAYVPSTGVMTLTLAGHGFSNGEQVKFAQDALTFTCTHGAGNHTYPRATDPMHNKWMPISNVTTNTFDVQVLDVIPSSNITVHTFVSATTNGMSKANSTIRLASDSLQMSCTFGGGGAVTKTYPRHQAATHTAAAGTTYNPNTGILSITTSSAHGMVPGTPIQLLDDSLTFSCGFGGGGQVNKTYPRSTDPVSNRWLFIQNVTATTFDVKVLDSIPSTNVDAHTFVSATSAGIIEGDPMMGRAIPIEAVTGTTITVNALNGKDVTNTDAHTWVGLSTYQHQPTAATYTPTTGVLSLTKAAHGWRDGDKVQIADNSLSFRCAMGDDSSLHTYPRATDPVSGRWLTISNVTTNTYDVNVGTTPTLNFTPTDVDYNPVTGKMKLTIGHHNLAVGNSVKFATESLIFKCAHDSYATNHSYPRSTILTHTVTDGAYNTGTGVMTLTVAGHGMGNGDWIKMADNSITFSCAFGGASGTAAQKSYPRSTDPISGKWVKISGVTTNTFNIQVLDTAPSTNTDAHTFVSATTGGVTQKKDRSYDAPIEILEADESSITVQVLSTIPSSNTTNHIFVSSSANAVITGGNYTHEFVKATSTAVTRSICNSGGNYNHVFSSGVTNSISTGGNYTHTFVSAGTNGITIAGDSVYIDKEALTFTCTKDNNEKQAKYPRTTDPKFKQILPIIKKDTNTFTINVGAAAAKDQYAHTFISATTGGVKKSNYSNTDCADVVSTSANLIDILTDTLENGALATPVDHLGTVTKVTPPTKFLGGLIDSYMETPFDLSYHNASTDLVYSNQIDLDTHYRYRDAANLIRRNRGAIVDKAAYDMLQRYPDLAQDMPRNAGGTSTDGTTRCKQDLGLVVDGIANDLEHGGNLDTITAANFYIGTGGELQHIRLQIAQSVYVHERLALYLKQAITGDLTDDNTDNIVVGDWGITNDATGTQFSVTGATYDPTGGDLVLTIGSHTLPIGRMITIAENGLTFSCNTGSGVVNKTYPRSSGASTTSGADYAYNTNLAITAVTATTITVNVNGGQGAISNLAAHTYVSSTANCVSVPGNCANVQSAIDTLITTVNDIIAPTGSDYAIGADRLHFNRKYIAEEITGLTSTYFTYTLNNVSYVALVYPNEVTCQRDIRYVIEGIISDLQTGGNNSTIAAIEKYITATLQLDHIEDQLLATIYAMEQIKQMGEKALNNLLYDNGATVTGQQYAAIHTDETAYRDVLTPTNINDVIYDFRDLVDVVVEMLAPAGVAGRSAGKNILFNQNYYKQELNSLVNAQFGAGAWTTAYNTFVDDMVNNVCHDIVTTDLSKTQVGYTINVEGSLGEFVVGETVISSNGGKATVLEWDGEQEILYVDDFDVHHWVPTNTLTGVDSDAWATISANGVSSPYDWYTTPTNVKAIASARLITSNVQGQIAGTNIFPSPENFNAAGWTDTGITKVLDNLTSPDTTLTADKLVCSAVAGEHFTYKNFTISAYDTFDDGTIKWDTTGQKFDEGATGTQESQQYTFSVFLKKGEFSRVRLQFGLDTGGAAEQLAFFDLNTTDGTVGSIFTPGNGVTVDAFGAIPYGDGWYRGYITCTFSFGFAQIRTQIFVRNATGQASFTGDGSSGVYGWGLKLFKGVLDPYQSASGKIFYADTEYNIKNYTLDQLQTYMSRALNGSNQSPSPSATFYEYYDATAAGDYEYVSIERLVRNNLNIIRNQLDSSAYYATISLNNAISIPTKKYGTRTIPVGLGGGLRNADHIYGIQSDAHAELERVTENSGKVVQVYQRFRIDGDITDGPYTMGEVVKKQGNSSITGVVYGFYSDDNYKYLDVKVTAGPWAITDNVVGDENSTTAQISAIENRLHIIDLKGEFTNDIPFKGYTSTKTATPTGFLKNEAAVTANTGGTLTVDTESLTGTFERTAVVYPESSRIYLDVSKIAGLDIKVGDTVKSTGYVRYGISILNSLNVFVEGNRLYKVVGGIQQTGTYAVITEVDVANNFIYITPVAGTIVATDIVGDYGSGLSFPQGYATVTTVTTTAGAGAGLVQDIRDIALNKRIYLTNVAGSFDAKDSIKGPNSYKGAIVGQADLKGRVKRAFKGFDGTTTTFPLTISNGTSYLPDPAGHMLIFLNGILQPPGGTNAYTAFSNQIQFTEAPDLGASFTGFYVGKMRQLDDISFEFDSLRQSFNLKRNDVFYSLTLTDGVQSSVIRPENNIIVSLNGVIQEPGVGFELVGSRIIFSEIPRVGSTFVACSYVGAEADVDAAEVVPPIEPGDFIDIQGETADREVAVIESSNSLITYDYLGSVFGKDGAGTAIVQKGFIRDVQITSGGSGYTSRPTVRLDSISGFEGNVKALVGVASVEMSAAGTGYQDPTIAVETSVPDDWTAPDLSQYGEELVDPETP